MIVDVEVSGFNRNGYGHALFVHDQSVHLGDIVVHRILAGNLAGDRNDLIAGNLEVQSDLITCGEVEVSAVDERTVYGVVTVGDHKNHRRLICNNEIGEVLCIEPNVVAAFQCNNVAFRALTHSVLIGTNTNLLIQCVVNQLGVRNLNTDIGCEVVGELCAVRGDLKAVEGVCSGFVYSALEGIGSFVSGGEAELHGSICFAVKLCERIAVQNQNVVAKLCTCNGQLVLVGMCIVEIQDEVLGHIARDADNVLAIFNGYVVVHVTLELEEVIGLGSTDHHDIFRNGSVCKYTVCKSVRGLFIPSGINAVVQPRNGCGNTGQINLCGDLCQSIGILCKAVAVFHHDGTDQVTVLVFKLDFIYVTVSINLGICIGHGFDHVAVLIGPCNELITGHIGIVFEYFEICTRGEICLEEHGLTVAAQVGDLVQVLEVDRNIRTNSNGTAVDLV